MDGGDLRIGFERRTKEARVERDKEEVEREWRAKRLRLGRGAILDQWESHFRPVAEDF